MGQGDTSHTRHRVWSDREDNIGGEDTLVTKKHIEQALSVDRESGPHHCSDPPRLPAKRVGRG